MKIDGFKNLTPIDSRDSEGAKPERSEGPRAVREEQFTDSEEPGWKPYSVSSQSVQTGPSSPDSGRHSPVTTGNGFGFAVYSQDSKAITRFYAHPYRFMRQNPQHPYADGPSTPNLIKHLTWKHDASGAGKAEYLQESNVIAVKDNSVQQFFYSPFGLKHNALITSVSGSTALPQLHIDWAPRVASEEMKVLSGRKVKIVKFKDIGDTVAIVPIEPHARPGERSHLIGSSAYAVISVEKKADVPGAVADVVAWQGGADPGSLVSREVSDLDSWRKPPVAGLSVDELKLWRQSETIMRMAQIREPAREGHYGEGLILASLPDGEWYIPWARDMSYATVALAKMGHQEEARKALDAYLGARPMGVNKHLAKNDDYQISTVRYNGDGSENADSSGENSPNIELDSWGFALWSMGEYMRKYDDEAWLKSQTYRGTVYENMRDFIAKPLMDNLDPHQGGLIVGKDTSIWEQNDLPRMHYAASTIAAISGLQEFASIADTMGDSPTVKAVNDKIALLQKGFDAAFVKGGRIHGILENSPKNDTDAAIIEAINSGIETDPAVIDNTLASMSLLAEPPGGYRRVTGDTSYELHEFLWSDFAMARAFLKAGRLAEAQKLESQIVDRSKRDNNLIPEMYVSVPDEGFPGNVGDPTGAIPMVGYGAGLFSIYLMDRAEAESGGTEKRENINGA